MLEEEDDDADEEERLAYEDQINRLRMADMITRGMSKEEVSLSLYHSLSPIVYSFQ
jgi:hypothetical protein